MKYALGVSGMERRRLEIQSSLLDPYTLRVLTQAGLESGKTLLDIGAGAGDVAMLAAEAVGRAGRVVGVDIEPAMVNHAKDRAARAGFDNVTFRPTSPLLDDIDDEFDIVFARLVLLFQLDKAAFLARAAGLVRPGGALAVVESAWNVPGCWSFPPVHDYDEHMTELVATAARLGIDVEVGARLASLFAEAGLGEPEMSAELVTGGRGSAIVEYNILSGEVMFDRARAASVACPTVEQAAAWRHAVRAAIRQARSQFFGPCLIGAVLRM